MTSYVEATRMKTYFPKFALIISVLCACAVLKAQNCNSVSFDIPLMASFPCYNFDEIDLSGYASPTGGTFSGSGISANGIFISANATLPPGSTAIDETVTITYTVMLSNGLTCTETDDLIVTVPIFVSIDPMPTIYCIDDPQIPITTNPGTPVPYPDLYVNGNPVLGTDEFFPAFYGPGEHLIEYLIAESCPSRDSLRVIVYDPAEIAAITSVSDQPVPELVCESSLPVELFPTPRDGILSGPGIVGDTFDPAIAGIGEHTIYYEFTTGSGACSAIDSTTIIVGQLDASFEVISTPCINEVDTLRYTGTPLGVGLSLVWEVDGQQLAIDEAEVYYTHDTAGMYNVTASLTGSLPCLSDMASEDVIKDGEIEVMTIDDQAVGLDAPEMELSTDVFSSSAGTITYLWTPDTDLSCGDCEDTLIIPLQTETYIVTATDDNGCVATDEVTITYTVETKTFVPNAFTPNGDGKNDYLQIFGTGIEQVEFSLFDRWGELVYYTTDPNGLWDGVYENEALNSAVFYYYLYVRYVDGTDEQKKGDVTLIR